jgi:hypothetical protein
MPPCHAHILHAFPSACRVTLFLNIGADDDAWSPQSPKSPSKKRSRAGEKASPGKDSPQRRGKGKTRGKGKGKDKSGKGKDRSGKGMGNSNFSDRPEDVEIGSSAHKLRTTFTDTHVQFGKSSVSKAALAKICNCGPNDKCWAVALSAMRWPDCLKLCPCPTKKGHESHKSSQHQFTPTERALCGKLTTP